MHARSDRKRRLSKKNLVRLTEKDYNKHDGTDVSSTDGAVQQSQRLHSDEEDLKAPDHEERASELRFSSAQKEGKFSRTNASWTTVGRCLAVQQWF